MTVLNVGNVQDEARSMILKHSNIIGNKILQYLLMHKNRLELIVL